MNVPCFAWIRGFPITNVGNDGVSRDLSFPTFSIGNLVGNIGHDGVGRDGNDGVG